MQHNVTGMLLFQVCECHAERVHLLLVQCLDAAALIALLL